MHKAEWATANGAPGGGAGISIEVEIVATNVWGLALAAAATGILPPMGPGGGGSGGTGQLSPKDIARGYAEKAKEYYDIIKARYRVLKGVDLSTDQEFTIAVSSSSDGRIRVSVNANPYRDPVLAQAIKDFEASTGLEVWAGGGWTHAEATMNGNFKVGLGERLTAIGISNPKGFCTGSFNCTAMLIAENIQGAHWFWDGNIKYVPNN